MELRDIEYFAVIAEHGNLGRAAGALGMSPPALSKSLRRLEGALQVKLVARSPKGVVITAEGAALLARARELRISLQNVTREIGDVSRGQVGHLRIGVGFAGVEEFLSDVFATLLKGSPRMKLTVTISDNDLMIPALRNGELDLFVNYMGQTWLGEEFIGERLYDDEHVVCAAANHRLARRKTIRLADLVGERWAMPPLSVPSPPRLHEKFRDAGLALPQTVFEARSTALQLRTVAASDLLSWTSLRFIEHSAFAAAIAILPVEGLKLVRPIGVVYRREAYLPPAVTRFVAICKAQSKRMKPLS
jgi:DNA-binding transcriptional LysR family regulator